MGGRLLYVPPPPPPPPWLTAREYSRPSARAIVVASPPLRGGLPDEYQFVAQRQDPGVFLKGPFNWAAGLSTSAVLMAFFGGISWLATQARPPVPYFPTGPYPKHSGSAHSPRVPTGHGECEVRRVSIAFDWSVRAHLQTQLDAIAGRFDMGRQDGLFAGGIAAKDLLISALPYAVAGCFERARGSAHRAQELFDATCNNINARYDQATINNHQRSAAPDVYARSEEGQGLVVVTLIVGINGNAPELPEWPAKHTMAQALSALFPAYLVDMAALEVVWSPSVDQDRLSSAELAVLYPELVYFDGRSDLGRVICRPCKTVFARELGRCPTCGASDAQPSPHAVAPTQQASSAHTIACPFCRQATPSYEVQCQSCGGRLKQ
ncbi:MAG: DUF1517 domain-containing protein [Deltaproteobacteria bacterium]|nr:DUF1517 domain-containing protein [Deltaproteobacteria bacterium]